MGVKTLITDGFDEGGEWLDADDRALLVHTLQGLVEKYVMRSEEASKARMAEPRDMTVLYVVDCPGDFPRIWIRNDRKMGIFNDSGAPDYRWQREGSDEWYDWSYVLRVTKGHRLIPIYGRSEW